MTHTIKARINVQPSWWTAMSHTERQEHIGAKLARLAERIGAGEVEMSPIHDKNGNTIAIGLHS